MASRRSPGGQASVQIEGGRDLRKALKAAQVDVRDMSRVHRAVVKQAKEDIRREIPVYTGPPKKGVRRGAMKASLRHSATKTGSRIRGGQGIDYYNVIEFSPAYDRTLGRAPRHPKNAGKTWAGRTMGRYMYPTIDRNVTKYAEFFDRELNAMLTRNFGRNT